MLSTRPTLWENAIHHMNGVSIGSSIAALHAHGVLEGAVPSARNEGYYAAALRFLEVLGWREDHRWTERGRAFAARASAYARMDALLEIGGAVDAILFGERDPRLAAAFLEQTEACLRRWDLDTSDPVQAEIAAHLDGPLIAPLAVALREVLAGAERIALADISGNAGPLAAALDLLAAQGWLRLDGMSAKILPLGRSAAKIARTYFYPVRYIPTVRHAATLIFGDAASVPPYAGGLRKHIRFSGQVFSKMVAEPFLEMFLPLFEGPLEDQPRAVVDIGCGDATMLAALYEAVRTRTARGPRLDRWPLEMVAVEYKAEALDAARETLEQAGVPHRAIPGDINDPATLPLDLQDAVLVTKSVIHTRPYRPPSGAAKRASRTRAVFVARDGSRISGEDMEQSLVELFTKWRPYVGRHGWLLVDAHTVDPRVSAGHVGRTMQATLDATHNFSHQYLIEMEIFRACAEEAGLVSRAGRDLGEPVFGHAYMSIDHLSATSG
jgi:hypothetical protein